jgi:glycosyltransferase involved in cell wall biosynthesis
MIGRSVPLTSEGITPLLAQNRAYFDRAASAALNAAHSGRSEQAMLWTKLAADCAWHMHPGFYIHPPLEEMLRELGQSLSGVSTAELPPLPTRKEGAKTWLHLITTAYMTGGHTRLVEKLIVNANDGNEDQHSILLIDQGKQSIPSWLFDAAHSSGGTLINLPEESSLVDRALAVRHIAHEWADRVILHVHPNDPVAPVAFAPAGGPPVIFVNHADHVFWLGAGCVDVVADIRPEGHDITVGRRGDIPSIIVPIPLDPPASSISVAEARSLLGIAANEVVLIAIASHRKFAPYGGLDFPANAAKILLRHTEAILLVVGPAATDPHWQNAVELAGGRLRLLGVQKEIEPYYVAADICLESYPFGSLTSTFDAMLRGVPVIRAPRGVPPVFTMSDYDGLGKTSIDSQEYLLRVSELITDSSLRKDTGERQRKAVTAIHTGSGWCNSWQGLVAKIPASHTPALKMDSRPWDNFSELDLVWSDLQVRQSFIRPDKETYFKKRISKIHRQSSRVFLFFKFLSAIVRGNWKGARTRLRNIKQLSAFL